MDLENGAAVFVGEGRSRETLFPFWKRLKKTKAKIAAVATDMNAGYISAVVESLPETLVTAGQGNREEGYR
ncbi:transposase [Pseudodesulfovibrio methanolicus]|uniref:Transposase n=1 Tax=Pseudodesulfovibrio methanolicus TaxID=3126690 RepID=A0ABZ2IUG4_9BACT